MDAYKLLSRSTSLGRKTATKDKKSAPAVSKLQSAAIKTPQEHSKKRKRQSEDRPRDVPQLESEIDFFRDSTDSSRNAAKRTFGADLDLDSNGYEARDEEEDPDILPDAEIDKVVDADRLPENECRKILASHKIRVTRLWPPPPEICKRKKRSKEKKRGDKKVKAQEAEESEKKRRDPQPITVFPFPLNSFAHLRPRYDVDARLAKNIAARGYSVPTEVQMAALPLLMDKHDGSITQSYGRSEYTEVNPGDLNGHLMTIAPTGSGKTLAFLIPIINAIARAKSKNFGSSQNSDGPKAIILAPTKELAAQTVVEARRLSQNLGVSVGRPRRLMFSQSSAIEKETVPLVKDDASDSEEADHDSDDEDNIKEPLSKRKRASRAPDIVVSAPLSLVKAINSDEENLSPLSSVQFLVLDEADVLLDPMFQSQTMKVWSACTSANLRVSLWSATMGSSFETTAKDALLQGRDLAVSGAAHTVPIFRLVVGLKDSAIPSSIEHRITYCANEPGKLLALRQLLRQPSLSTTKPLHPPFLIFTQTIPRAIALASELKYDIPTPISVLSKTSVVDSQPHSRIAVLHADLRPSARDGIMSRFRAGEIWLLITTDLLSRGVDFPGVNAVINYDLPQSSAAYVHRVGRAGRTVRNATRNADANPDSEASTQGETRRAGVAITFVAEDDIPYLRSVVNVIERAARAAEKKKATTADNADHNAASSSLAAIESWMLASLPKPSKLQKQTLKKQGVASRRKATTHGAGASKDKDKSKALKNRFQTRISTKSGYERRMENRRRDAIRASQARKTAQASHD